MLSGARILRAGLVTPVGLTAAASAAAIRAGITRIRETPLPDRRGRPLIMSLLSDEYLPALAPGFSWHHGPGMAAQERVARMLRLAGLALQECVRGVSSCADIPLLLALPEEMEGGTPPASLPFLQDLARHSGVAFDVANGRVIERGRAGGLILLQETLRYLSARPDRSVLIGGVDTYLDLDLLQALESQGRLHTQGVGEGIIPGEAAAFLLCSGARSRLLAGAAPMASISAVGIGEETAHRYTQHPCRGEGLATAIGALWPNGAAQGPLVHSVLAGLIGERDQAKEWAAALIRHRAHFAETLNLSHPADCIGDVGAAMGPLLLGLGALGLQRGYRTPPCMIWCSSDRESRGAALLGAP